MSCGGLTGSHLHVHTPKGAEFCLPVPKLGGLTRPIQEITAYEPLSWESTILPSIHPSPIIREPHPVNSYTEGLERS